MFMRVVIPLIIVGILALLLLAAIFWTRRKERYEAFRYRQQAEEYWDGVCQFDNPDTGAKCQREEFHLENHYREVNGKMVLWP